MMRKPNIPKIYGNLGELFALDSLLKSGHTVCRADGIVSVGHSFITNKYADFDFSLADLQKTATTCPKHSLCRVHGMPCQNRKATFYRYNPDAPDMYIPTKDGLFTHFCGHKLTYAAIQEESDGLVKDERSRLLRDYLRIHIYIQSFYDESAKAHPYPTNPIEQKVWRKYWDNHPGKLDFFAAKDGKYMCLDAKVNSSALSKWQAMRLAWMQSLGYRCGVVRVCFKAPDNDKLTEQYTGRAFDEIAATLNPTIVFEEFDINQQPEDYQKLTPSRMDVFSLLKKRAFHGFDLNAEYNYIVSDDVIAYAKESKKAKVLATENTFSSYFRAEAIMAVNWNLI